MNKSVELPSHAPVGTRVTVRYPSGKVNVHHNYGVVAVVEPDMRATFEQQERARNDFGGFAPKRETVWVLVRLVRLKKKVALGTAT